MNLNYHRTPNKLVYQAFKFKSYLWKRQLQTRARVSDDFLLPINNFSKVTNPFVKINYYYNEKAPALTLSDKFSYFSRFKISHTRVHLVPFEFDIFEREIRGSVVDLDYGKILVDPTSQDPIQYVKRNVYLQDCAFQHPIVDDDLYTAIIEGPNGYETKNKVYLFSTDLHPRYEIGDRLAPLMDLQKRHFCVRPSYVHGPFLIDPVNYIDYQETSDLLLYNPMADRLCDADHEDFYRKHYPKCFAEGINTEDYLDDAWPDY